MDSRLKLERLWKRKLELESAAAVANPLWLGRHSCSSYYRVILFEIGLRSFRNIWILSVVFFLLFWVCDLIEDHNHNPCYFCCNLIGCKSISSPFDEICLFMFQFCVRGFRQAKATIYNCESLRREEISIGYFSKWCQALTWWCQCAVYFTRWVLGFFFFFLPSVVHELEKVFKYMWFLCLGLLWYLETKYQLHAKEVVQSLDLAKYDGIVCVSGDGILVEVGWSFIVAYLLMLAFSFMKLYLEYCNYIELRWN